METIDAEITRLLEDRNAKGNLRLLRTPDSSLTDFSSNDYLGLARSEQLQKIIHEEFVKNKLSNGSTGSRLLTGNSRYAEELESKLQQIFRAEGCLLFTSGYAANIGVLSSLPKKGDTVLYDEKVHASLKDGVRLSLAARYPFHHNDIEDLESKLRRSKGRKFVVVESIYSMDGDECPLPDLIRLKNKYDFEIVVDEAHSTGVVGSVGEGMCVTSQLHEEITVRIYTFGKALGSHGACVASSGSIKQYLTNFSRPFIYSTALSPHTLVSISEGFNYIAKNPDLGTGLRMKSRKYLENIHPSLRTASRSAIQTVILPGNENCKRGSKDLQQKGFDVRPILSPTVAKGAERLRICLHSYNTDTEIANLTRALNELAGKS